MGISINHTLALSLKNNSGVNVSRGDVVVIDKTLADSFTVTGSKALIGVIGVVLDQVGISAGSSGMIGIKGYIPFINLVTGANIGDTFYLSSVVQKAQSHSSIFAGDFGQTLSSGLNPDAVLYGNLLYNPRNDFVAARYYITTGGIPNNTDYFPRFDVLEYDTNSAFTTGSTTSTITGSSTFTAPTQGYYRITSQLVIASDANSWAASSDWILWVYKNSDTTVKFYVGDTTKAAANSGRNFVGGTITLFLNAGDTINIATNQNSGFTKTLLSYLAVNAKACFIEIIKVG